MMTLPFGYRFAQKKVFRAILYKTTIKGKIITKILISIRINLIRVWENIINNRKDSIFKIHTFTSTKIEII